MSRPVPAPREGKRPVPTPRKHINKNNEFEAKSSYDLGSSLPESVTEIDIVHTVQEKELENCANMDNGKDDQFNTFSRRVTNASKQIADTDKMNFEAIDKLSSPQVTDLLIEAEAKATKQILIITRYVLDAFLDKSITVEQRIYFMWYSVFFLRIWGTWIKSQSEYTLSKNWLTTNVYTCIELNAHSLLIMIEKCRMSDEGTKHFLPWLFSSQPCEKFFRQIRSMTSTYSTIVNFDMLDILQRINRVQVMNDIIHDHGNQFIFPRELHKKMGTNNKEIISILPCVATIKSVLENAKAAAITDAQDLGLFEGEKIEVIVESILLQKETVRNAEEMVEFQMEIGNDNSSDNEFENSETPIRVPITEGDINQLVQGRKKAVIEGTRQSMRRLTRRFSSVSQEQRKHHKEDENVQEYEGTIEMFNNIRFESPLSRANSVYSNVENEFDSGSSNESINLPPPKHPPPPLPDESLYDAPTNSSPVVSSSNSSQSGKNVRKPENYESVFPAYPYNSDSESCIDGTERAIASNTDISRSASWAFYDSVTLNNQQENIYANINKPRDKAKPSAYENVNKEDIDAANKNRILIPDKADSKAPVEYNRSVSIASSENHTNSVYENHEIQIRRNETELDKMRTTKSVIMQFDPLSNESSITEFSEMNLLEEMLQGDLYGTISEAYTFDEADWSISNESESEEFLNPPTPPLRFDSLPEEECKTGETVTVDSSLRNADKSKGSSVPSTSNAKSRTSWFTDTHLTPSRPPVMEPKKSWLKQVTQHVLEKAPEVFKGNKNTENLVERPILGGKNFINKKGMLYKVQGGPVEDLFGEYSGRWCVLENSDLFCYSDNTCLHLKEHFPASNILSIQLLQDAKYKYRYDNDDLHCFELNITGKSRGGHIYGSRIRSERRIWLQCLVEMLTQRFKSRLTTNFIRMGWAYVREGVSGKWAGAWILLSERELHYAIDGHSVKTMDLRKARCIVLQGYQETDNNPRTNDKGPNMLVDCPDLAVYLRMWTSRETKVWCHMVKLEAHNNGANLDQQQLTKNDIPVIVEKCINFIYAHGSMSEGIYRKSGTSSSIAELLSKFRKDAFAVQLTRNNCTEYEVASALKRFFRELPEPLFGCDHRQYLCEVAKHNVREEKIRMFKAALDQLPPVSYKTARKLLGHLHFISNQSDKNLMSVTNLAAIWGPTLMHYEDKDRPNKISGGHLQDSEVVCQLIRYYRHIFPEDPGELEKEKLMLKVLKKHMDSLQGSVNHKTAGEFRVWIYIFNKEGKSFNVAIGPQRTAYEVCLELSDKINSPVHEIILEEVVLSDRLYRPIHHTEKVLDVVLKWSYWDEADRKDNYLTCVALSKYWEYIIEKPLPISGDLRFADNRTKLHKLYMFQFTQGTLSCFKDKMSEVNLYSWRIEDITWYLGHETKRTPQSRWTMTFLENGSNPHRTRNSPYFGNILIWNDAAVRANWLGALLKARYPNNLTPPPKLVTI